MGPIVVAVIFGIIVLGALAAYAIYSGAGRARRERDEALAAAKLAERAIRIARRGLMEIGGNQSGNPIATAQSTIREMEELELEDPKKESR